MESNISTKSNPDLICIHAKFEHLRIGDGPYTVMFQIDRNGVLLLKSGWIQRWIIGWLLNCKTGQLKEERA